MFDITSACSNFNSIVITVFASNILGDGPSSEPVFLEFSKLHFQLALESGNTTLFTLGKRFTHNQDTSDTPSIALYSIVGGSSIAVILSLLLVIITLASFIKKIYTSFQR